jgi:hypothetical protein
MTANPFRYPDDQWERLEAIVQGAGGDDARDKFTEKRDHFERMVGGWKVRLDNWNGYTWGADESGKYKRVELAASELKAALDDLKFPAIFAGDDLLWKPLDGTEENWKAEKDENPKRFEAFRKALDGIRMRTALMAAPRRKRKMYARDRFFIDLWRVWRAELDLAVSSSHFSSVVEFVATAAEGVYVFQNEETALETISNVIRKGPRRAAL